MSQPDKFERAFWKLVLAVSHSVGVPAWSRDPWETRPAVSIPLWIQRIFDEEEIEIPSTLEEIRKKLSNE